MRAPQVSRIVKTPPIQLACLVYIWRGSSPVEYFFQQLINGLTLGSIYGLIAIGYTMVFGIIGMVNFAHGDVFMLSTFIALILLMVLTKILSVTPLALVLFLVLLVSLLL